MMTKGLRRITIREIVEALEKDGFTLHRTKGNHYYYKKNNRLVTVPYHHSGDTLPPGTLHRIIKQAGWTEADLKRLELIK
jgi:predicted RNA binding protein YcfA (HicA-like mRNA interferase family)